MSDARARFYATWAPSLLALDVALAVTVVGVGLGSAALVVGGAFSAAALVIESAIRAIRDDDAARSYGGTTLGDQVFAMTRFGTSTRDAVTESLGLDRDWFVSRATPRVALPLVGSAALLILGLAV